MPYVEHDGSRPGLPIEFVAAPYGYTYPGYIDIYVKKWPDEAILDVFINMKTLRELGQAVATRRQALGLRQHTVALQAGLSPESLSRFERGHSAELGSRKLLSVLAVLGLELQFTEIGFSGSLDELRQERAKS